MAADAMPIFSAPRRSTSLFSFGATAQGVMERRSSMRTNQGSSAASVIVFRPIVSRQ
jgi:hypothetical protein